MARNWIAGGAWILGMVLAVVVPPQGVECVQRMALQNDGTYTLQNVADYQTAVMQGMGVHHGYLTAIGGSDFIVTDQWKDIPGQKWQVSKGYIYTAYIMKPLSEGIGAKVGMDAVTIGGIPSIRKAPYTFGLASDLYWAIIPAEGNFYMIQNLQNDLCLESRGLGQPVGISPCRTAKNQQWAVHARLAH